MPKVSVIVPIYGVEQYLRQCLDSIVNQTLEDIEIILIDDGGKDGCPVIIDEYAACDSRIIAIHKQNGGYGHTCNMGLSHASGEYVAIVEPDDYIDVNMYEDLYKIAKENDSDVVKSAYWEDNDNEDADPKYIRYVPWATSIRPPSKVFNIFDYSEFLYHHPSIWSCIYKTSFLREEGIRFVEAKGGGWVDNPFQVMTLCLANRVSWTPNAYYHYRPESVGNSSNLKDYKIPVSRLNEIHDFFDKYPRYYEAVFDNFTKREIPYLYNAFKVGFKNITDKKEIGEFAQNMKSVTKRISKDHLRFFKFRKGQKYQYRRILDTNYLLKYYTDLLFKKEEQELENSVL